MYGRDSLAELEGFTMGSFTDTIQSIIGAVESGAQQVTNIARGIANISQATSIVAGQAAKSGGSVFTPTPADIAAQKADVAGLLGINVNEYLLIGGGLILLLVLTHRK
jgi:hypothetical protein